MDLLTILSAELDIPIISTQNKMWFLRTKSGSLYEDFFSSGFIALGWDLIQASFIKDKRLSYEAKKVIVENLYPDEKRPGLILGQMDTFYNKMNTGDLVIIPSEGGRQIAVGRIGEIVNEIEHKVNTDKYAICEFKHKRVVSWLKTIDCTQDIYLFRSLRAQQTISDMTSEAKLVFRNMFPIYVIGDNLHLTFQKKTTTELRLENNVYMQASMLEIIKETTDLYKMDSFIDDVSIKTAVGSPGFLEMISPAFPVPLIAAFIITYCVKTVIGNNGKIDGSGASGLIALIGKINDLINDHHNRKKIDAETERIRAETDQIKANTRLLDMQTQVARADSTLKFAQALKTNAEVRENDVINKQTYITSSGYISTEFQARQEELKIPAAVEIENSVNTIVENGNKLYTAMSKSGMTLGDSVVSSQNIHS